MTIPEVTVTWWDIENDKLRTSVISAHDFMVHASTTQADVSPLQTPKAAEVEGGNGKQPPDATAEASSDNGNLTSSFAFANYLILSAVLIAAILLICGLWWSNRIRSSKSKVKKEPHKKTGEKQKERQLFKKMSDSVKHNDTASFYHYFRRWLPLCCGTSYAEALRAFQSCSKTPDDLDTLVEHLYGSTYHPSSEPRSRKPSIQSSSLPIDRELLDRLMNAATKLRRLKHVKIEKKKSHRLEELYPTNPASN